MSAMILIADDDPVQRRLLEAAVTKLGHRCLTAGDGDSALDMLRGPQGGSIELVILDLVMPGLDGMGVLAQMREEGLDRPVIVQTAQGGIETVVNAMRAGADDFVVKPVSPERLKVSIINALKLGAMEVAVQKIRKTSEGTFTFDDMIAQSPAMEKVVRLGERGASSNIPVLIEGTNQKPILTGNNTPYPVLKHLPKDSGVIEGTRLVTSGDGGVFPFGLPVGKVIISEKGQKVIEPFANMDRITYVRIIDSSSNANLIRGNISSAAN